MQLEKGEFHHMSKIENNPQSFPYIVLSNAARKIIQDTCNTFQFGRVSKKKLYIVIKNNKHWDKTVCWSFRCWTI